MGYRHLPRVRVGKGIEQFLDPKLEFDLMTLTGTRGRYITSA